MIINLAEEVVAQCSVDGILVVTLSTGREGDGPRLERARGLEVLKL